MSGKITRRNFLETAAKGMAAVAFIPPFLHNSSGEAFMKTPDSHGSLSEYLDHFNVTEAMIREVMADALSKGGDYCDLYFQHAISNSIGLEDKLVNRAFTNIDLGVGIRVLKGDQTGYSFTEDLSLQSMKTAARTAAAIADAGKKLPPQKFTMEKIPGYYPIKTSWETVGIDKKIPYLESINEKVMAGDSRIIKASVSFSNSTTYNLIVTSEGKMYYDYQPMSQLSAFCTAEQDGKREQNYFDLAGRYGIEFFSPSNIDRIASESVRRTIELFKAVKPEAGEMEVVLAAGSSGILLHEAIGHGMEADFNRKGTSIFSDKIDKKVANDFVTIIDDGTNPNVRGSINIDDEGNDSQKTFLVENGILRSYLHDRISAQHYGVKPTGNGRRQSFRHIVLPRMRNTYMLPGPHKKEEIIKSVKKGIYAETFTNGQVMIGAGDFTFYVKSGFLIENGEITKPIKDVNIIGNGPQVLKDITMVADDFEMAEGGWTCGKDGQGVPVSMGQPTLKVAKITVGGTTGKA